MEKINGVVELVSGAMLTILVLYELGSWIVKA